MRPKTFKSIIGTAVFFSFFAYSVFGCKKDSSYRPTYSQTETEQKNTLTVGTASSSFYEPTDMMIQYMNKRLKNKQLQIVTGSNYEEFLNKISKGIYDITLLNGLEALKAQKYGYKIVAKFESDST